MRTSAALAFALLIASPAAAAPGGAAPELATPQQYRERARAEATARGIPPELAEAVMKIESGYNPAARGGAGEIGLMQVMPGTAVMLDPAVTPEKLAEPGTNIALGVRYLADAWKLAGGDICTAVMKYRAGHGETRFSLRSVNYCIAARKHMAGLGFKVTGSVPKPEFGFETAAAGPITFKGRVRLRLGGSGKCFARVVQPGKNFGRCIAKARFRAKGLVK